VTPVAESGPAASLLYAEAAALDEQRWDDWLSLYEEDAEFWVPAWNGEHELTSDPDNEISLIYYRTRSGLEDRIFRLRLKQSSASIPMPRTCHLITNIRTSDIDGRSCKVAANWQTHSYRLEQTTTFYGRYEYVLALADARWRIRKKKVIVLNDLIPTVLDIYSV
jgi:3-phenylpropionate/cinnamic acid dioxygenase small subunit